MARWRKTLSRVVCPRSLMLLPAAWSEFPFHVATYPDDAVAAPQGPTSVWDYENKVNPASNIHTSSPYDIEDLYRDKNGFALQEDGQIR